MTWLITGGCGFVGTNLAEILMKRGVEIVILDNLSRIGSRDNLAWLNSQDYDNWRFVEIDIRDTEAMNRIVKNTKPDVLAHLAGQVAMTTSIKNPRLDFEVNLLGTINVLEAVRLYSPSSVVLYSSTNKVYGSLEDLRYEETETRYLLQDYSNGLDEKLPLDGYSPYGCSKLAADQYMRDYYRIYNIPTLIFRHSSMYGSHQFATYDQGWIGWFCLKALESIAVGSPPFFISGNGKQVRDVLHTEDVVDAYIKAVESIEQTAGQVYNLGGGVENSLSLLELFDQLNTMTGAKMKFRCLDPRPGDQKVFIANFTKASRDFGWSPKVNKENGLRRMIEWSESILSDRRAIT